MNRKDVKALGIWIYKKYPPPLQTVLWLCMYFLFIFNRSARPRAQDLISSSTVFMAYVGSIPCSSISFFAKRM